MTGGKYCFDGEPMAKPTINREIFSINPKICQLLVGFLIAVVRRKNDR